MTVGDERGEAVARHASRLVERLGRPAAAVVLGSGFAPLGRELGGRDAVSWADVPGVPSVPRPGIRREVAAGTIAGRAVWCFSGRLHRYEGVDGRAAALPCELLAAAGGRSVLLTAAVGGLAEGDRPGDFAVVRDHIDLAGPDPVLDVDPARRDPPFVDLTDAYDPDWSAAIEAAASRERIRVRPGILAAVSGPSYETSAEVRALRRLGADLASMSVASEATFARYLGLRVAAVTCIANLGSGLGPPIDHDRVVRTVTAAVERSAAAWVATLAVPPSPGGRSGRSRWP